MRFIAAVLICAILLCGCRGRKSVSEMSDEEKIAFAASEESELSADEKALQNEVRRSILARTAETDSRISELEEAVERAKSVLSQENIARLEAAQDAWNRQGRGRDINALVKSGVPAAEAYGLAMKHRAQWIDRRSVWAMLIDAPGELGGFYRSEAGRTAELYEMRDDVLNLVIRYGNDDFVFTATGKREGEYAILQSESDILAAVRVVRLDANRVRVDLEQAFSESSFGKTGTLIEGVYRRVSLGEMDVFAQ